MHQNVLLKMVTYLSDVIKEVERVLEQLSSLVNQSYTIVGGVRSIVSILNTVDRAENILWKLLKLKRAGALQMKSRKMFVFEDILTLDDRSIQVLREVDNNERLAVALKGLQRRSTEILSLTTCQTCTAMIKEGHGIYGSYPLEMILKKHGRRLLILLKIRGLR